MSTQITTAFVNQFSQNIQLLSQQMGSLLRNSVRQETVTGEKAFSSRLVVQWRRRERRGMPALPLWIPHASRMVTMSDSMNMRI